MLDDLHVARQHDVEGKIAIAFGEQHLTRRSRVDGSARRQFGDVSGSQLRKGELVIGGHSNGRRVVRRRNREWRMQGAVRYVFMTIRRLAGNSRPDTHSAMDTPSVRAPDFPDTLDWIHTGGRRLTLADFRGRMLLLDFWTYG